jgi:opacity protein-like surface antigen
VLASIGYEWDHWRFEGEVGYRQDSMNRIAWTTGFPGFSSNLDDLNQLTLMANMLYDIPLGDRFSVSLGAGVGFDRIDFNWPGFGANGWSDDDWQFAWQGIVGLNYEISPEWNVFVDYRYLNADGPDFTKNAGTNYALHFDDIDTQTVSAGLRWHFSS